MVLRMTLFGYVCLKLLTDIALCNIYALSRIPLPYDSACFDLLRICWTILDFVAHFLWLRCTKIQQVWTLYATTFVKGQRNLSTLVYVHCQCPTITTQKSPVQLRPRLSTRRDSLFAAERRSLQEISTVSWYAAPAHAAINRYLLPTGRLAANHPHGAAAVDRWDRRRTDTQPLHTAILLKYLQQFRLCTRRQNDKGVQNTNYGGPHSNSDPLFQYKARPTSWHFIKIHPQLLNFLLTDRKTEKIERKIRNTLWFPLHNLSQT